MKIEILKNGRTVGSPIPIKKPHTATAEKGETKGKGLGLPTPKKTSSTNPGPKK